MVGCGTIVCSGTVVSGAVVGSGGAGGGSGPGGGNGTDAADGSALVTGTVGGASGDFAGIALPAGTSGGFAGTALSPPLLTSTTAVSVALTDFLLPNLALRKLTPNRDCGVASLTSVGPSLLLLLLLRLRDALREPAFFSVMPKGMVHKTQIRSSQSHLAHVGGQFWGGPSTRSGWSHAACAQWVPLLYTPYTVTRVISWKIISKPVHVPSKGLSCPIAAAPHSAGA